MIYTFRLFFSIYSLLNLPLIMNFYKKITMIIGLEEI
mgnify:CR=1 FL=1